MNSRAWLMLYLTAVIAITFVHHVPTLALVLFAALALAGKRRWQIARRTLLAMLAFNLTVSLGYAAIALWQGNFHSGYLLLVNVRVFLLLYLGFWFVAAVDLLSALSGMPLLRLVATLSIGQIKTFERILNDFGLAFRSRNLARPRLLDKAHHAASQAQNLLDKSVASANETALAMRSRGAFDD
ncbi:MAG: ABC transporter permease [Sideroxydans sp.]|nr:ABC transporter permease [Sideroxydans sp.]